MAWQGAICRALGAVSAGPRDGTDRSRAPSEPLVPDATLRQLHDRLRLTSVHVILGVAFDASESFAK